MPYVKIFKPILSTDRGLEAITVQRFVLKGRQRNEKHTEKKGRTYLLQIICVLKLIVKDRRKLSKKH